MIVRSWVKSSRLLALAVVAVSAPAFAQTTPAPDSKPDAKPAQPSLVQPGETPERARERIKAFLTRQIENWKPRVANMERALQLINDGAPLEQVAAAFPESTRPGGLAGRIAERRERGMVGGNRFDEGDLMIGEEQGERAGAASRPGQGGPGRGGPVDPSQVTDEQTKFVLDFLRAANPAMAPKLEELMKSDPEAAKRRIAETWPRIRWLWELHTREPETFALRMDEIKAGREAIDHARWLARHDDPAKPSRPGEREEQEKLLRAALAEQYRVRGKIMERDLARLHDRIEHTQKELTDRTENEQRVVEESVRTMIEREKQKAANPPTGPGDKPNRHPDKPDGKPHPPQTAD